MQTLTALLMMGVEMRIADALPLTPEDRRQLETWAKEKTAPARIVERARILLLLADGGGIHPAARHKRDHVHFTPTSGSWLNMVERIFRDITENRLRRGVFRSVEELEKAIHE